jgi:succinylglutamate desuccinylase
MGKKMNYLADLLASNATEFSGSAQQLSQGIIELTPESKCSRAVILSCAIHGNETAPIEIINDLLTKLVSDELTLGTNLLIIFGHISAMKEQRRFIDFNLNRLFNGHWRNRPQAQESKRAQEIEAHVKTFIDKAKSVIHLDLHTAIKPSHHARFALCPSTHHFSDEELNQLTSLGLDALVTGANEPSTFSAFTQTLIQDGYSATVELGKVKPFGENNAEDFTRARFALDKLVQCGKLPADQTNIARYQVKRALTKDHEHYELYLAQDNKNFEPLDPTKPLEKTLKGLAFPEHNEYLIFPNDGVVIGGRSGLIVSNVDLCEHKKQDLA